MLVAQPMTCSRSAGVRCAAALALVVWLAMPAWGQSPQQPQAPPPAPPQAAPAGRQTPEQQAEPVPAERERRRGRTTESRREPRRGATRMRSQEERTSRDPGLTRRELTLAANLNGGYDDNLTGGLGGGAGTAPRIMASGSTGYFDAALGYFYGNALRSVRVDAAGSLQAYPDYLDGVAPGGAATISAQTNLGRRTLFRASERVGYEPLFSVFSPGASSAPLPGGIAETAPAAGLYERRSASSNALLALDRQWGRRDATSFSYMYRVQRFTSEDYGDNSAQDLGAEHRRTLARGVGLRAAYRHVRRDYTDFAGEGRATREHRIEGGPEIEYTRSRRRSLSLLLAGGAAHVESLSSADRPSYSSWVPIGSGTLTLGLPPNWSLQGGYQRDFALLRGVTDEVYTTDTAFGSAGGLLSSRVDLRLGGSFSRWRTSLVPGLDGRLRTYGGSLQLGIALTGAVAATAGYHYYHHRYSDPAALPEGFPARYNRHAVRVGIAVWVPLMGAISRPTRILR